MDDNGDGDGDDDGCGDGDHHDLVHHASLLSGSWDVDC